MSTAELRESTKERPPLRPSTRLVLVRHGQAGGAGIPYTNEVPLTATGRRQAERTATAIALDGSGAGVAAIYSSPHRRALDSARALAARMQREPQVDDRLMEFRLGCEDTQSIDEIVEELRYLMLWRPHDRESDRGESLWQFQSRVSAFLDEASNACLGRSAVIFTHGGTIAAAMRWAYGLTPEHDWHSDVELFNASITEVEFWPNGRHALSAPYASVVHRLNDIRHLPADLVTAY